MLRNFIAGIDIGGTKTAVAIAEPHGAIVAQQTFPMTEDLTPEVAVTKALFLIGQLATNNNGELCAIGVACPGPLDFEAGKFLDPPNMSRGWHQFPIRSFLEQHTGLPVAIENDANAAAIGEHLYGAGRGFTDLVYLTISTGIGGGIIAGGELAHRYGEAGHVTVQVNGDRCGCGASGCLEAMCSGTAIARRARHYLRLAKPSQMLAMVADVNDVTAQTVVEALRNSDELAGAIWKETIKLMAIGIGSIIALLAPQAVILGGGVATGAGELLLAPLREELKQIVRIVPLQQVQILPAGLGVESGLYGAIVLGSRYYSISLDRGIAN